MLKTILNKLTQSHTSHYPIPIYVFAGYITDGDSHAQHGHARMHFTGNPHEEDDDALSVVSHTHTHFVALGLCKSSTHTSEWWYYYDKGSRVAGLFTCDDAL